MSRYILIPYDPRNNPDNQRLVALFILAVVGFVLYWLGGILGNFQQYPAPYKFVAAFYYFTIIVPLKTIPHVWQWFVFFHPTPWPNMNSVIRVVGIISYTFILLSVYMAWVHFLGRMAEKFGGSGVGTALSLFWGPAMLAFFWFIFSNIFGWLFA